jgi:oligopeptide transport system permease protein
MWPLLVYSAGFMALAVAAEAILSFLGIGLDLPSISWGSMLSQIRYRVLEHPHLLSPALFLSATVAAFVFLAEALRRASERES